MPRTWLLAWMFIGVSAHAAAQDVRPGIFGTIGVANVYRAEDQSFGTELNAGAGGGIDWKHLGLDVEVHTTRGLTPRTVGCASVSVPCTGSAREGFLTATMLTGNVSYFFGSSRVRPYVIGSVGALWTEGVNSLTVVTPAAATVSEFTERDTGLALGIGAGVDVPLTTALSLRPEFRTYSSTAMSRVNLGMHRVSASIRYRW